MQIIVLDGWHKGEVIKWAKPQAVIRLLKPPVVTKCDCNLSVGIEEFGPSEPDEIDTGARFNRLMGVLRFSPEAGVLWTSSTTSTTSTERMSMLGLSRSISAVTTQRRGARYCAQY